MCTTSPKSAVRNSAAAPILLAMDMFDQMLIMDPKMAQQCYDPWQL